MRKKQPDNDNRVAICYLYVIGIREGDRVLPYAKIGISDNVERRIAGMQTGTPFEVFCEFRVPLESRRSAAYAEANVHEKMEANRIRGEWFGMHPTDAAQAAAEIVGGPTLRMRRYTRMAAGYMAA